MQRHLISWIFSYLAMTSFVLAQTATCVIRGTVQDSTGAILTQVHVRLIDEARNQDREQTTNNEEGFFEFRALPLGNYRVEVEHPQFKKGVIDGVALQVAETKNLRATLLVGLEVRTRLDSGTEVELSIPGDIAYGRPARRSWFSRVLPGNSRDHWSTEL